MHSVACVLNGENPKKLLKSEACRMADRETKRVTTKLLFSISEFTKILP